MSAEKQMYHQAILKPTVHSCIENRVLLNKAPDWKTWQGSRAGRFRPIPDSRGGHRGGYYGGTSEPTREKLHDIPTDYYRATKLN